MSKNNLQIKWLAGVGCFFIIVVAIYYTQYRINEIAKNNHTTTNFATSSSKQVDTKVTSSANSAIKDNKPDAIPISFTIGDELIEASFSTIQLKEYRLAEEDAAALYEKLAQRANRGEPIAARLLSGLIRRCGETYADEAQHKEALAKLTSDKLYPTANPQFQGITVDEDQLELFKNHFEREFNKCKGLTIEQRAESRKWAKVAADNGDFLGLEMLTQHPDTSPDEKIALLEKQWKEFGFIDASTGLTIALSGMQSEQASQKDLMRSYAYYLVSSSIKAAIAKSQDISDVEIMQEAVDDSVFKSLLTSKLGPREHIQAEKLAAQLIRENPNCCTIDARATMKLTAIE